MQFAFSLSKKRVLVLLLVIAFGMSLAGSWGGDFLRMPASWALAPVSDYIKASTSAFKTAMTNREEPAMSSAEAAKLRRELADWKNEAWSQYHLKLKWWEECNKIQKIRAAYKKALKRCELMPATVILGEALPYGQSQTLSSGTIHGVKDGMRVVDLLTDRAKALPADDRMRVISEMSPESGSVLVGWVESAGSFTARVRLITDKRFKINARVARVINTSKPRKVTMKTADGPTEGPLTAVKEEDFYISVELRGDGDRGLVTGDIPKGHNVLPGDLLTTSGKSAKLPAKLRIGKVVSVEQSDKNPNFVVAKVAPIADLGALRNVYIVRSLVSPPPKGRN